MSGFPFYSGDGNNANAFPTTAGHNTVFIGAPGDQQVQGLFFDPLTGIRIVAGASAQVFGGGGATATAEVTIHSSTMPFGSVGAQPMPIPMPLGGSGLGGYPGGIATMPPLPGLSGGIFDLPFIPAVPPPVPNPVFTPAPAPTAASPDDDDEPVEAWPAPLALAPPGPNTQPYVDAINRFIAGGWFAWVHNMNGAQTVFVNGTIDAMGSVLDNRTTVIGTIWNGGCMIMNMCEHPDEGTMETTGTVYGHMVCRVAGYMMYWQPRRQDHPEAISFIVRPVDSEGKCAVDHRGYMERTFKGLDMKWVEMQYRDGDGQQYVALALKGRSSPMVVMSSGWNLTLEGGLSQGEPQWPM